MCVSFWDFSGIVVLYNNAFYVLFLYGKYIWYTAGGIFLVFGDQDDSLVADNHGAHKSVFLGSSVDPKREF